ncbi:MAG TPA: CheR family methyltransferase, partial [Verrucomicrobiae bacterium]|nr:CheR family methyltransferase [Verrucomicrobiae bacterium]
MAASDITENSGAPGETPAGTDGHETPLAPRFVVGIGTSAAGLESVEKFFTATPCDSGMAFVVIGAPPAAGPGVAEALRRCTPLQVVTVEGPMPPAPDTVFVPPPGKGLTLSGGRFQVERQRGRGGQRPVDRLFRSMAADLGETAFAVVLSGPGSDGAEGAKVVKGAGGTVLAEDPATAPEPSMPDAAVATGAVDLVLPPEQMPQRILEISRALPGSVPAEEESLASILRVVKVRTGNDFSSYKRDTVRRRLERRIILSGARGLAGYLALLEESPREAADLAREILIGVTGFFRDAEAFEALEREVLPRLLQRGKPDQPVRIWDACCSTGEEVYSVAILVREYLEQHGLQVPVQIFATDLDDAALAKARSGVFSEAVAAAVGERRLQAFFTRAGGGYQAIKQLREMIVFAHHNLIKDPPFSRLDLLICRNFLIYLKPDMQRRLVGMFHQVLRTGGVLFLGNSESVGQHSELFSLLDKKWKIFVRREVTRPPDSFFPVSSGLLRPAVPVRPSRFPAAEEPSPRSAAEKLLLSR